MCSLKFDYTDNRFRIGDIKEINITESVKQEFEDRVNNKFAPLCEELNRTNGYVKVSVSQDGTKILKGTIVAVPEILDYIVDNGYPAAIVNKGE